VWNVATGTVSKVLSGHHGRIYSATFSPDGRLVATASDDRTVRIWSVETGKVKRVIVGHEQRVTDAVFTSDGSRLLTSAEDGTFRQWAIGEVSLLSGAELRNRVCESILSAPAAQMFSVDQMKQPVLEGLTDDMQNPCERTKPFK
jgi:WD40 repeat protein